jgi:hypothetical protein
LPEGHSAGDFHRRGAASRNFFTPGADASGVTCSDVTCSDVILDIDRAGGIGAMWIVMYVAMIASLSAMGLAPSMLPIPVERDQLPGDDA